MDEQFRAVVEELDEMEALIEAARKQLGLHACCAPTLGRSRHGPCLSG